jgi:Putative beta-barrel porin-2, OmpL-like. bbp2
MKHLVGILSIGLLLFSGQPVWGDGGEGEAESFKDTLRAMQERIKELEDEVSKLKAAPPSAPAAAASTEGVEKRLEKLEGLSILKGIEIHGFLAGNYTYNLNRPKSRRNGLLLFNEDHNTFSLNHANIQISKTGENGLGFLADLDFGDTAEIVGGVTRWSNSVDADGNPTNTESRNSIELRQAYLTYKFGIGNGLTLKAGKFVTLHGAEVIKSWNSFNYNISNSILFGWAIPFTHTGLMASYPFNDYVSMDLGLVNGWDNVADNNDGKTVHGGLTLKPHPQLTFYLSGSYGPEQNDRGDSKRAMLTTLVTYKPTDRLTLILDHNWGNESELVENSKGNLTKSADWHGVAGYAIYSLTDKLSASLRAEWFSDMDATRTGLKQDLWEITPTLTYSIAEGLFARFEYRHDESNKRFFENHRGDPLSGQDVFATELIYAF